MIQHGCLTASPTQFCYSPQVCQFQRASIVIYCCPSSRMTLPFCLQCFPLVSRFTKKRRGGCRSAPHIACCCPFFPVAATPRDLCSSNTPSTITIQAHCSPGVIRPPPRLVIHKHGILPQLQQPAPAVHRTIFPLHICRPLPRLRNLPASLPQLLTHHLSVQLFTGLLPLLVCLLPTRQGQDSPLFFCAAARCFMIVTGSVMVKLFCLTLRNRSVINRKKQNISSG